MSLLCINRHTHMHSPAGCIVAHTPAACNMQSLSSLAAAAAAAIQSFRWLMLHQCIVTVSPCLCMSVAEVTAAALALLSIIINLCACVCAI